jgi:predicted permease
VEPDDLVVVQSIAPGLNNVGTFPVAPEFFAQYRQSSGLQASSVYKTSNQTSMLDGVAEHVRVSQVSADFFRALGVTALVGRMPSAAELDTESPDVVLISHAFWTRRFGADPTVVGKTIELGSRRRRVIGVMGPEMTFPEPEVAIWSPFRFDPERLDIGSFSWTLLGRVAGGTDKRQLEAELGLLAKRVPEAHALAPDYISFLENGRFSPLVTPLDEFIVGSVERPLWLVLGTVGLVLLVGIANVATLFLARAESRECEMGVRAALGANRVQLLRTHLGESVAISIAGGALGVLIAWLATLFLPLFAPAELPRIDSIGIDVYVLGFVASLSLLSALVFSVISAVRFSSHKVLQQLVSGGRGTVSSPRHQMLRNSLVIGQTCMAIVLLVGAGLLLTSFGRLMDTNRGFDAKGVLTFRVALSPEVHPTAEQQAAFHLALADRIGGLPGVERVGVAGAIPLSGSATGEPFEFDGAAGLEEGAAPIEYYVHTSPGYFATMGITLEAGRAFVSTDHENPGGAVIVSRAVADRYWPGQVLLGKQLKLAGHEDWNRVVGVVADVRDEDLRKTPRGLIYMPVVTPDSQQMEATPFFVVKADDPLKLVPAIREEIRQGDRSVPMYDIRLMEDVVSDSIARVSFTMTSLSLGAVMALILAAVGLYSLLTYVVVRRTQEIGIRLTLGANRFRVVGMIVHRGTRLVALGVVLGAIMSGWLSSTLASVLYDTDPVDPVTIGAAGVLMLFVGVLASFLPARRAANVDPLESIRA